MAVVARPVAGIPAPPADPALPALATALDGEAVRDLLIAATPDAAAGVIDIVECRPAYIRYKPRAKAIVRYDATLRHAGAVFSLPLQLEIGRAGHAAKLFGRTSFGRLVGRAVERHPGPPQPRAVVLDALDALVQWFPVDRKLPDLERAASAHEATKLLGTPVARIDLVRHRPGRKAVLRWAPADAGVAATWVRIDADGSGERAARLALVLRHAGVLVPATIDLPDWFGGTAQRDVGGRSLAESPPGDLIAALTAAGELLARLHGVSLSRHGPALPSAPVLEADRAVAAARKAALLKPGRHGVGVERLAERVASALTDVERPAELIHGDFHHDQMIFSGATPVLIDLDTARRGDRHVDLGNALAHLDDPAARDALLEGYGRLGRVRRRRIALFETAALIDMALGPFRRLEPDWPDRLEALVELAARRFAEHTAGKRALRIVDHDGPAPGGDGHVLHRPSAGAPVDTAPTDLALPTLHRLLDAHEVRPSLSAALGRPIGVRGLTVVRHKPGRRATLRWDLDPDGTGERLFVKTYASDRGPAVHAVLRALASAGLPAGSPTVPTPVAWLADLRAAVQREVPGVPVTPLLLVGDREVADLLADAVAHLHACDAVLPRRHDPVDELAPLAPAATRLSGLSPALAPAATRVLGAVRRALTEPPVWRYRPIHRDLYHDQVLVGPHGVSLVDLDDAAMGEPAIDVANLVAHLRLLAMQDGAAGPQLEGIREQFLSRVAQLDPGLDPELLRVLEAGTLLRIAPIHRTRARGEAIAAALIEAAESLVAPRPPAH